MAILTILILPMHKHRLSLHVYVYFSTFSTMFYSFYCTSFPPHRLIFKCFYSFDAVENGIVFSIPLSGSLFLLYRNVTDFCKLISVLQLHNLFISCNILLVKSLEFSIDNICYLKINLISSPSIWSPFILLPNCSS